MKTIRTKEDYKKAIESGETFFVSNSKGTALVFGDEKEWEEYCEEHSDLVAWMDGTGRESDDNFFFETLPSENEGTNL